MKLGEPKRQTTRDQNGRLLGRDFRLEPIV